MSNKQKQKPKRLLSLLLALTMVLGMLPVMGTTTALAYTGNGTKSSPYVVTTYDEMRTLFASVSYGSPKYIKLGADIIQNDSLNEYNIVVHGNFCFDLNGYTLKRTALTVDESLFVVEDMDSLTIYDSSEGKTGTLEVDYGDTEYYIVYNKGGNVCIEGGNFISDCICVRMYGGVNSENGTTTISGGTFNAKKICVYKHYEGYRHTLNIYGGTFDCEGIEVSYTQYSACIYIGSSADVNITGGSFTTHRSNVSAIHFQNNSINYDIDGGTYKIERQSDTTDSEYVRVMSLGYSSGIIRNCIIEPVDGYAIYSYGAYLYFPANVSIKRGTDTLSTDLADSGDMSYYSHPILSGGERVIISSPTPIEQITISDVVEPVAGKTVNYSATVSTAGAEKAGVTWVDVDGKQELSAGDTFKADHTYMVIVTLNALEGYAFNTTNDTLDISINGNKGYLGIANARSVQCCYNFETLPEPQPVITTQPSGGDSPYMGDSIVLKIDAENANEYIWHIIDEEGKELSWNYLSNNGYATPATSEGGKKLFLYGVSDWMTGKRVYCEVKGNGGTVMSDIVTLSVDKVVKYCRDMYFDNFDEIWNHKTVGDYKNVKTDTNAPYTITEVRWQLFNKVLSDDFEFNSGDTIALLIGLAPKEGYELYVTSDSINGINSVEAIHLTDGRQYLQFEINITAPEEYKTQNIELSVAEPVAGVKPSTTAKCTSGYAIPGTPSWTPADTTFKSGTQYTVKIPVTAEFEMGDIDTVTAKVNGKDAKFIAERKTGKIYAYYVEYTFEATKDYMLGDVNGDGKISVLDATLVQKYLAGLVTLSDTQKAAADVNGDGSVSVLDATQIQKYIAGLISNF